MRPRRPAPLHRRLTMVVAAVLVVAVGGIGVAFHLAVAAYLNERLDTTLRDTPVIFMDDVASTPGRPASDHDGDPTTGPREQAFLQRRDAAGTVLQTQAGEDLSGRSFIADLPSPLPELVWSDLAGGPAAFFDATAREPDGPRLRVKVSVDARGETLVIATPRAEADALLNRLTLVEVVVSVTVLLAACGLAWWLVRRRLAPLRRLARSVESLTPDSAARVEVDTKAREVHDLAVATNDLLQRIDEAFAKEQVTQERLRQFVADASHELRTPIAAVSAYAQLFDLGAKDRPADLARSMAGIRRETARMRELTEELLTLAATEAHPVPEVEAVDVATVVGQAVDAALAVDPCWPATLSVEPGIDAVADPAGLRRVLDNLIDNVRTHTPPGTATRVAARRQGQDVVISVVDDGPGLSEDERARMFDRFWRKDKSRSRQSGGSGLGLSIVVVLVESWHGRVTAAETPGGGLTVTVALPAATYTGTVA